MSTLIVGQKIRKSRRDLEMTQEELAKKMRTTKATINKYELGVVTNIPRSKLQTLAEILQIDPEELFDYETTANTYRQQLQNIDNEIKILDHTIEQKIHRYENVDADKRKLDSLEIKRDRVLADIMRLEMLIDRERQAEAEAEAKQQAQTFGDIAMRFLPIKKDPLVSQRA